MKRSPVGLSDIADYHTLLAAFHTAARGKRGRADVEAFRTNLHGELAALRADVLAGTYTPGPMRRFRIRDPKPRIIHAPSFRDRVLHHALMAHVGPVLDRALVFDTYACRPGKGTLAAVQRAAEHARRSPWYGQIDIAGYFAHIDHAVLLRLLARKFKNGGLLALLARILAAYAQAPGIGLPIGTLTSQHFANFYLGGLDRLLLEVCRVRGFVRYMDDVVWWTADRATAQAVLAAAGAALAGTLHLAIKQPARVAASSEGLAFCGFRILPGRLLLSRRRRRRYTVLRRAAERAYLQGRTGARGLQAGYASALAVTAHAPAADWRRGQLRRHPLAPALAAL